MLSSTGLTAGVAALLLAVAVGTPTEPTQPPAAGAARELVVAQDGSGDFTTITDAVAEAADGDTVLVRPGTYTEAFVIEADIAVVGDGPREDIVITAPEGGPTAAVSSLSSAAAPYAVLLDDTTATLSGFTFRGLSSQVHIHGGAPTVSDLHIESVGMPHTQTNPADTMGFGSLESSSMVINGGSRAVVRGNLITHGAPIMFFDDSEPIIEANHLADGPYIWGYDGDGTIIRGNTIERSTVRAIGVFTPTPLTIEGNIISDPGTIGIHLLEGGATVTGNTIKGASDSGILVAGMGLATALALVDNELIDNATGISSSARDGVIEGNAVTGGQTGIVLVTGSPVVRNNTIEGASGRGLVIAQSVGTPTLTGNRSCGNGENLYVAEGANVEIDDTNEICEDTLAAAQ